MALSGQLNDLSLAELIEFFCNQHKTGRLRVSYPQAPGFFYFQKGMLVDAKIGVLNGVEAVYYALTLENASFNLTASDEPSRRTIHQPWAQVALEGLRRMDEGIPPSEAFPDGYSDAFTEEAGEPSGMAGAVVATPRPVDDEVKVAAEESADDEVCVAAQESVEDEVSVAAQESLDDQVRVDAQESIDDEVSVAAEESRDDEVSVAGEEPVDEVSVVAQESLDEVGVFAQESIDDEVRLVGQESIDDEETVAAQESLDDEVRVVAQESADDQVRVAAQECPDEELRVAEESLDDEVRVAQECSDEELRVAAEESPDDEVRVATEESPDDEVRVVAQESANDEVSVAAEESVDDEVSVAAQESPDDEVSVAARESPDDEVSVAVQESPDDEVSIAAQESVDDEVSVAAEESVEEVIEIADEEESEPALSPPTPVRKVRYQTEVPLSLAVEHASGGGRRVMFYTAIAVAVLISIAAVGFPAGWYSRKQAPKVSQPLVVPSETKPLATDVTSDNSPAVDTSLTGGASESVPGDADLVGPVSDSSADTARRQRAPREHWKAAEEKPSTTSAKPAATPASTGPTTNAAKKPDTVKPKTTTVQVTYDEAGRVTQASGGDSNALRIARQKRFPPGKAGTATVTIPVN